MHTGSAILTSHVSLQPGPETISAFKDRRERMGPPGSSEIILLPRQVTQVQVPGKRGHDSAFQSGLYQQCVNMKPNAKQLCSCLGWFSAHKLSGGKGVWDPVYPGQPLPWAEHEAKSSIPLNSLPQVFAVSLLCWGHR